MRIIWAERLRLSDLALLWPLSAARGAEVRYDEHKASPAALAVLRRLAGAGFARRFSPARLTLNVQDARGRALNYRREADLEAITEPVCRLLSERPEWFRRTVRSYLCGQLMFRATFLLMAEAAAEKIPGAEREFYVVRHPLNGPLIDYYSAKKLRLTQSFSIYGHLRIVGAPLLLILRALRSAAFGTRVRSGIRKIRPAVWVEYLEVDLGLFGSRTFWHPHLRDDRFDRVFYVDRSDTPYDAETISRIERFGFRWIDCSKPWELARPSVAELAASAAGLLKPDPRWPWWLPFFDVELELWTMLWADVCRRFQVKLLFQHQEFSWKQAAQARALERAGGRMFGTHWSDFPFTTEPIHLTPPHVYFVWGRNNRGWLEGKGHDCRHILPCGAWILPDAGAAAAFDGLAEGARFRLAVFDSSFAYNVYNSAETVSEFLLAVLSLLEAHPDWGAVLKPKNEPAYRDLPRGGLVEEKIAALVTARRLVVVPWRTNPVGLACAADLSVCYGHNSAGILAGAFGRRAVHWDSAGWTDHPLYRDPAQRILFPSLERLKEAAAAAAEGDATVGDFSKWRRAANHFDDREAPARVARWLEDYMSRALEGASAEEALERSVEQYRRRNGVGEAFDASGGWWEEALHVEGQKAIAA